MIIKIVNKKESNKINEVSETYYNLSSFSNPLITRAESKLIFSEFP
jgi:hypothetical protein